MLLYTILFVAVVAVGTQTVQKSFSTKITLGNKSLFVIQSRHADFGDNIYFNVALRV